jgi:serine/threonine protein kinase
MAALRARGRQLPPVLGAFVIAELCTGLGFAHESRGSDGRTAGIVHRDVSPQNILINADGEVKVADFGIAKTRDRQSDPDARVIKGKYFYMSPEQASAEVIDRRSDLYSAGIVLFELLTGERPYRAASLRGLLDEVRAAAVPPPSSLRADLPPALDAIVARATARDPGDRYDDARGMGADLDAYLEDCLGVEARRFCRRRLASLVLDVSAARTGSASVEPALLPETRDGRTLRMAAEPATPAAIPLRYQLDDGRPTVASWQPEPQTTGRHLGWVLCGLATAALWTAAYLLHGI